MKERYGFAIEISSIGANKSVKEIYLPPMVRAVPAPEADQVGVELAQAGSEDPPEVIELKELAAYSDVSTIDLVKRILDTCAAESGAPPIAFRQSLQRMGYVATTQTSTFPYYTARSAAYPNLGDEFIFQRANSCDVRLARQELLLCAAQRVSSIADAVGVTDIVTHEVVDNAWAVEGKLRIQPQRPEDRFIARDLSLVLLAELAKMDSVIHPDGTYIEGSDLGSVREIDCDIAYGLGVDPTSSLPYDDWDIYGVGDYASLNTAATSHTELNTPHVGFGVSYAGLDRAAARALRVSQRAKVLQGAANLTRKLVDDTMRVDAELAERNAANVSDPALAAAIRWGFTVPLSEYDGYHKAGAAGEHYMEQEGSEKRRQPFNNYGHSATMLYGRLERFGQGTDSGRSATNLCNGLPTIDATQAFYATSGSYARARAKGSALRSARGERAVPLFVEAGFAPRHPFSDETGYVGMRYRSVLQTILAERRGVGETDPLYDSLRQLLNGYEDAELEEAGGYVRSLLEVAYPVRGVRPSTISTPVGGYDGDWQFAGALPLGDAEPSAFSSLTHLQNSSLCTPGTLMSNGQGTAMQGAVGLGASLSRQMQRLAYSGEIGPTRLDLMVQAASVHGQVGSEWFSAIVGWDEFTVRAFNLDLRSLGVADFTDYEQPAVLNGRFALVMGDPWMADCAAGLRDYCPEEALAGHVSVNVGTSLVSGSPRSITATGAMLPPASWYAYAAGPELSLRFDNTGIIGEPSAFGPYLNNRFENEWSTRLMLVVRGTRAAPGRVIGPLRLGTTDANTPVTFSSPLGKLFAERTESSATPPAGPTGCSKGTAASVDAPKASCIVSPEGLAIPAVSSVPLENELTADSDPYETSYRHYLERAKEAAAKADELGREIIANGLQTDLRKEAGQEALAALCGTFGIAEGAKLEKGKVVPGTGDPALADCLGTENYNFVYVGNCVDGVDSCCNAGPDAPETGAPKCKPEPPPGGPSPLEQKSIGLGLVVPIPEPPSEPCASLDALTTPGVNYATELLDAFNNPRLKSADVAIRNSAVRFVDDKPATGETTIPWHVSVGNKVLMHSKDPSYWPACETAVCDETGLRFQKAFGAGLTQRESRWRVQQAVWLMARIGGRVPAGMFDVYVPVRDGGIEPEVASNVVTVFGNGHIGGGAWVGTMDLDATVMNAGEPMIAVPALHTSPDQGGLSWTPIGSSWGVGSGGRRASLYQMKRATNEELIPSEWAESGEQCGVYGSEGACATGDGVWKLALKQATNQLKPSKIAALSKSDEFRLLFGGGVSLCHSPSGVLHGGSIYDAGGPGKNSHSYLFYAEHEVQFAHVVQNGYTGEAEAKYSGLKYVPATPYPGDTTFYLSDLWFADTTECSSGCSSLGLYRTDGSVAGVRHRDTFAQPRNLNEAWTVSGILARQSLAGRILSPQACPPSRRVATAVYSAPPGTHSAVAQNLVGTYALACTLAARPVGEDAVGTPPSVSSPADIAALSGWTAGLGRAIRANLATLYLENVPKSVVSEFRSGLTGAKDKGGEVGRSRVTIANEMRTLKDSWKDVADNLDLLAADIETAGVALHAADIAHAQAAKQVAMQQLQLESQRINTVAAAAGGMVTAATSLGTSAGGLAQSVATPALLGNLDAQASIVGDLAGLAGDAHADQVSQILIELRKATTLRYAAISKGLTAIQMSAANTVAALSSYRQLQNAAMVQLGKVSGDDYVYQNGKPVAMPVNTVMRRQSDAATKRYAAALTNAKYLAYLARTAIEQRLGVRLETLTEGFGAQEAPAKWVPQLCTLEGVDYKRLREAPRVPDGDEGPAGAYQEASDAVQTDDNGYDLSRQFIGDYVQKLQDFVEYYNVKRPSADSDDQVPLSLRDDLLVPVGLCVAESRNLLLASDSLEQGVVVTDDPVGRGWERGACSTEGCLLVTDGTVLPGATDLPVAGARPTWLHESSAVPVGFNEVDESLPTRTVTQSVKLKAGTYVFSYWHQLRSAAGEVVTELSTTGPAPSTLAPVVVGSGVSVAVAPNWVPAYGLDGDGRALWSPRQSLVFTVAAEAEVRVGFRASGLGEGLGSVLVGGVQLEQSPGGPEPTPYQRTGETRLVNVAQCAANTPSKMRDAFRYVCGADGCAYELITALVVDTTPTKIERDPMGRRLAVGNHNFRHASLALNLVGTGVVDCAYEPGPSCYANGVVEYTLDHEAFNADVTAWDKSCAQFDFGKSTINHGKALASERFITSPTAPSDQALLTQLGVEKAELRGRPLDGRYRLKIWNRPGLVWSRVEDIQIVLKYHSWSAVRPHEEAP